MPDSAFDSSQSRHSPVSRLDNACTRKDRYLYAGRVLLVVCLGVWLRSPVLAGTRISDDWDHYAMVEGIYPARRSAFDLYDFISAAPSDRAALLRSGRLPWWSDPQIRISFFRPLASLSTYADYAWLGAEAAPERPHLHSLLWWVASLVAVAAVLRAVFVPNIAILALLLFALDEGHALPVAWSASRAEIIATAFMMCGLWCFIAWSKRADWRFGVLAFVLITLALLAGEHALSLFPYVVAYGVLGSHGVLRARLLRVAVLALPVAGFLLIHVIEHYGVAGSSFYSDPFGELPRFLSTLPQRCAWLLGDALLGYSADWSFTTPPWVWWMQARGVPATWLTHDKLIGLQTVVGVLAAAMLAGIWARAKHEDHEAVQLRWLLMGAAASLVPLSSAFAMTRLTVAPGFAIHACLAVLATQAYTRLKSSPSMVQLLSSGAMLLAITLWHGALAASRSYAASTMYAAWSSSEEAWVRGAQFDVPSLTNRRVFVVSAHDTASQYALPFVLHLIKASVPVSSQILLPPALAPLALRRSADNTLELTTTDPNGHFGFLNSAYRRADPSFISGQQFSTPHFRVEVVSVVRGIPRSLRFVFERSLDDPAYVFMYPSSDGLQRLVLPATGESRLLPPPAFPRVDSGEVGR